MPWSDKVTHTSWNKDECYNSQWTKFLVLIWSFKKILYPDYWYSISQPLEPLLRMTFYASWIKCLEAHENNLTQMKRWDWGTISQPCPAVPKKQPVENSSLTGFQKRWEKRWPPAGLRCWNSFCRRSPYGGKPRMRSSAGRHMKTQTHFAISICSSGWA